MELGRLVECTDATEWTDEVLDGREGGRFAVHISLLEANAEKRCLAVK